MNKFLKSELNKLKNNNNYKSKNFELIKNLGFKDFNLEFKNYKNVKEFYKSYLELSLIYNI
jgi:hypothetical protein